MKPVAEWQQVTPTLFVWSDYNPDCKTDCASTAVLTPEGLVLIDPFRLEPGAFEELTAIRPVAGIVLTNGNHDRDAISEQERLNVPLRTANSVSDGEILFGSLRAISLPGGGASETAYLAGDVLIVGDALINLDGLAILPDKYCEDPKELRRSLGKLADVDFEILCFAHGLPITQGAKARVRGLIESF